MMSRHARSTVLFFLVLAAGFALGHFASFDMKANAQGRQVFELRTYTAPEGRLPNLLARFRDHTMEIFERHGMTNVGYWVPQDSPASENTLIYIIAHDSREAAQRSWDGFRADPEWQRVAEESQVDGRLVSNLEAVFLEATDFSPMQ